MSKRFSIRSLIIVMTFVAIYFAVRRYFILFNDDNRRIYLIPPFFAVLAVVTQLCFSKERRLLHMIGIGATVSFVVATALTIEIAEGLGEYWDWSADYLVFLAIVGGFAIAGGVIGIAIRMLLSGMDRFTGWIGKMEAMPYSTGVTAGLTPPVEPFPSRPASSIEREALEPQTPPVE